MGLASYECQRCLRTRSENTIRVCGIRWNGMNGDRRESRSLTLLTGKPSRLIPSCSSLLYKLCSQISILDIYESLSLLLSPYLVILLTAQKIPSSYFSITFPILSCQLLNISHLPQPCPTWAVAGRCDSCLPDFLAPPALTLNSSASSQSIMILILLHVTCESVSHALNG